MNAARAGEYVAPKSDREYDQYEVGKHFVENSHSLSTADVKERALRAMIKRVERGDVNVPSSTRLGGIA